jgi:excisionase family DNA binding protein
MGTDTLEREAIRADERDVPAIKQVEALLTPPSQATGPTARARLVGASGEEVELPGPIYDLLRRTVPLLLQGDAVALVPYHKELTTQEAADVLNISRQYLIKLLDRGEIPYTKTGTHRRLAFQDVLTYNERRHAARRASLARLTALAEEAGDYD